ncbi:MAG: hypothetical protein OXC27_15535 [Caldilineaceae bacterium]|nr:hypothetical protein [Caldilineaceae bacterium]
MIEDIEIVQKNYIEKKAAEYRSRGYEVEENCPLDFLPGFRADLVVRKNGEAKVIEVRFRTSLAGSPQIEELARILHDKPGWSFELMLVGEPERLDSPEGVQSFAREEILQRLDETKKALDHGLSEAAFLLVWSAFEAATRELIAAEGVSIARVTKTGHVLDQAVHHGVISREDYDYLANMRRYRNAIAHGFDVSDFNDEKVTELIAVVRRLLDSEPELV